MYPETPRRVVRETLHGVTIEDPYRWLEDVESAEVRAWMDAQDSLTRGLLAARPDRAAFVARLREVAYVAAVSPPVRRGRRLFFTRRAKDAEKSVHFWKEEEQGEERVLLDPLAMDPDGSLSIGVVAPTFDGERVAYSLRPNNADAATLYLMDVATGKVSDVDVIEGAKYASPQWVPDGSGFYYTALPTDPSIPIDQLPGRAEIRYHKVGTPPAADTLVHPALNDPTRFLSVQLSRDGRWLFIYIVRGWTANDVFVRDLHDPDGRFVPLAEGVDAQFWVIPWRDVFYIITNDGAPRRRVLRCDPPHLERARWVELVAEQPGATLEGASLCGEHLVIAYTRDVATELRVHALDGRLVREVELPGIGSASSFLGNEDEDDAYFTFSSFTIPPQVYRTSVKTGETSLWATIDIPVDPAPYVVEQVWYASKDGTQIPMFLVHRRDMKRDGNNPTLLYGYGGFSVNMSPAFSGFLYAWLERGGVYASPALRGGGEFGEDWHRAGMREVKQNTFDDFIAAAEWLIANGIARPEKLVIRGGSNGGLLVGAAMVQRPDLFRAVSCAVPLLDMLRYHLFGAGRTWVPEYGSAENADEFRTLAAYSPYHHVAEGARYPALLMMSADADDRVDPMHARKMTAALQHAQAGPHPILLRVERNAGHGGADLRRQAVEEYADLYSFLTWQLGL